MLVQLKLRFGRRFGSNESFQYCFQSQVDLGIRLRNLNIQQLNQFRHGSFAVLSTKHRLVNFLFQFQIFLSTGTRGAVLLDNKHDTLISYLLLKVIDDSLVIVEVRADYNYYLFERHVQLERIRA